VKKITIHHYQSSSGKDVIKDYIEKLTKDEQVDAYHVLQNLQNGETDLLTIKPWEGKIKEVYFYKDNRIFYVAAHGTDIYILHICRKQKNKTEKKDAKIIRSRFKELICSLKSK